jgi:hypothetical protein
MNTIKIKIIAWEADGQSLICKYASDETASSNPDDYNSFSFQPKLMWPHATTADAVLEEVARAGISICEEIKTHEDLANNPTESAMYSGLSGTEQTFNVSDLTPTPVDPNAEVDPDTVEV